VIDVWDTSLLCNPIARASVYDWGMSGAQMEGLCLYTAGHWDFHRIHSMPVYQDFYLIEIIFTSKVPFPWNCMRLSRAFGTAPRGVMICRELEIEVGAMDFMHACMHACSDGKIYTCSVEWYYSPVGVINWLRARAVIITLILGWCKPSRGRAFAHDHSIDSRGGGLGCLLYYLCSQWNCSLVVATSKVWSKVHVYK
jgi:hypothetical protein